MKTSPIPITVIVKWIDPYYLIYITKQDYEENTKLDGKHLNPIKNQYNQTVYKQWYTEGNVINLVNNWK